jgi:hypothetical protein
MHGSDPSHIQTLEAIVAATTLFQYFHSKESENMNMNDVLRYAVGAMLVMAAGCTHYYRVSDPVGTKLYYTTGIDKTDSGAIRIKDEKTGADVTLQSSEVKEISQGEYEAALKGQSPKP